MDRLYPIALREYTSEDGKQAWTLDIAGRPIDKAYVVLKPITAQEALPLVLRHLAKEY